MSVTRHRGLTEPAADAAIDAACRNLRLPTMRGQFSELADAAARDQMTYRGFLAELLMAECDDRNRRRSERRIKAAGFPAKKHCAPRLCAAIVDRLTFGGNIIETGSGSYRLARTRVRAEQQQTAS